MTFPRYYCARGTRQGGHLDPPDPTAVFRANHEAELAVIAAIEPDPREEYPPHETP